MQTSAHRLGILCEFMQDQLARKYHLGGDFKVEFDRIKACVDLVVKRLPENVGFSQAAGSKFKIEIGLVHPDHFTAHFGVPPKSVPNVQFRDIVIGPGGKEVSYVVMVPRDIPPSLPYATLEEFFRVESQYVSTMCQDSDVQRDGQAQDTWVSVAI